MFRDFFAKLTLGVLVFLFICQPINFIFAQELGLESSQIESAPIENTINSDVVTEPIIKEEENIDNSIVNNEEYVATNDQNAPSEIEKSEEKLDISEELEVPETSSMSTMGQGTSGPYPNLNTGSLLSLPEIDKNTGSLNYSYTIVVPPGRDNFQPDLKLVYSSNSNKVNGIFGSSWYINIPYIQRLNKNGTENIYDETSDNYFYSSIDGELVSEDGSSFIAKTEGGNFNNYTFSNNTWTMTAKDGSQYKFGLTSDTQQNDPNDTDNVYKWMLEEIRDTNDNYIEYSYYKNAGQIYPDYIKYTGNDTTDGIFEVDFIRSSSTYIAPFYETGFSVTTNYYISEIDCKVNGTWVNKYTIDYDESPHSDKLLLNSIILSGQDESSNVTTFPATTFNYQENDTGWTLSSTWDFPSLPEGEDSWLYFSYPPQFPDFNGDGLSDLFIEAYHSSGGGGQRYYEYLNTGSGWSLSSTWDLPTALPEGEEYWMYFSPAPQFVDFNGDGLTDLLVMARHTYSGGAQRYYEYLNTGSGWSLSSTWDLPTALPEGETSWQYPGIRPQFTDVNADGLNDLIAVAGHYNYGYIFNYYIYVNTGSGWESGDLWAFPTLPTGEDVWVFPPSVPPAFVDLNSDGLADLVAAAMHSGIKTYYTYLNTGSGWSLSNDWAFPTTLPTGEENWQYFSYPPRYTDLNGDGLVDMYLVASHYVYGHIPSYYAYLNTGLGWSLDSSWAFPTTLPAGEEAWRYFNYSPQFTDMSSDGLVDMYLVASHDNYGQVPKYYGYLNNGPREDLLIEINYPQGGETNIVYKNVALYSSSETKNYPYPIETVYQTTTSDGAGLSLIDTYDYQGGQYYFDNPFNRQFSGYNYIIKADSAGNITKTYYNTGKGSSSSLGQYQDNEYKIGKIFRLEKYDDSENLYEVTVNKWDSYVTAGDAGFVKLIQTTEMDFDGLETHKDKAESYTYDNGNGNLTQKIEWGQVNANDDGSFTDTGSDKYTTEIDYAYSAGSDVLSGPSDVVISDQNSNKVKQTRYYYDELSLGSIGLGNQTKIENWTDSTNYVNTQKSYNGYGLVTVLTDPNSNDATYTYDNYNLYSATITNALDQDTDYLYNYGVGKTKQITDPNGFVYQTTYDGLGRIKEEKVPGDSSPYTPVTKTSYIYTDTSGAFAVHKTENLDGSTSKETYQYFDGLGRIIQNRVEDETSNTFDVTDIVYNNLGLKDKESLPYTSSGSSKTTATTTTALYTSYVYDPLYRVASTTNAIGTIANDYDNWQITVTDLRGKEKDFYSDAYGNLVQVGEHNSGNTYTTAYTYDGNNKLTSIIDALNNVRNFTYDGLGRRLTAQDLHASGDSYYGTYTYGYDNVGNLTSVVNPNSQTINYTYDDINRILTENYTGQAGTEVAYTYDTCTNGIGKLCSIAAATADDAYVYDSRGNIASQTRTIDSVDYDTAYTYDRQGNQLEITNEDSSKIKYSYNTAGQLETVQRKESTDGSFINVVTDFDYGPDGQIIYQAFANGATTTNTYDASHLYRLSNKLTVIASSQNAQDLTYTYDNNGNITQIIDASDTDTAKTANYTYDDLNRLTQSAISSVAEGQSAYTYDFDYNAIGDLVTSSDAGIFVYAGNTGTSYANPHAATTVGSVTYTYDNAGNLTDDQTWTHTYNYNNRLIESDDGATNVTYAYDSTGQRVLQDNGTITTTYPTKYFNTDGVNISKSIFLPNGSIVATVSGSDASVVINYIHADHLSGVNVATDENNTISELIDYYPFGNIRIDDQTATNTQRKYIGQEYDADTDLNYLNARYYDANRGQFTSQDPVFWMILTDLLVDPQQLNSYSYARNNPLIYVDRNGEKVELVGRSVLGIGTHLFYHITPDHPDQINIQGLPASTKEFTLGGYNPDFTKPFTNKLEKGIGYEGHEYGDYPLSNLNIRGSVEINPPKGESDSDLINNLGRAYENYSNDVNYNMFGNLKGFYNANSNTFVNEIGNQAGIGDQVKSFNPSGISPGSKDRLPTTSVYREIKNQIIQIGNKIQELISKVNKK